MAICGLNISLDSLQEDITTKVSAILEIEPTLITPAAVKTYLTSLFEPTLDALKVKVDGLIPDIPVSLSGFSSLRSDLSAVVSSGGSGLSGFLSTYSSVSSLSGMANINLSDLANSAISLGGSFDPCSVINVMKGASGDLEQLAEDAPEIGKTVLAGQNLFADQSIIDDILQTDDENLIFIDGEAACRFAPLPTSNPDQIFDDYTLYNLFTLDFKDKNVYYITHFSLSRVT